MTPDSDQGRAPQPDPDHQVDFTTNSTPASVPAHADNRRPRHRVSRARATDQSPVDGLLIVNLGGRGAWPDIADIRRRLWMIESLRPGARAQIEVANVAPMRSMVDGLHLDHVRIEIVSEKPVNIDRWVDLLRGVNG